MVEYDIHVNNGVEAFGTTGKTLSAEEKPRTISIDFLAEELHHANELIPQRTIREVLSIFGTVSARLMAEGFAIQFQNDGDVLLRLYTDVKVKDGNINLARARQLTGNPALTEQEMVAHASEIVQKAGVVMRSYAEVQNKFNELLHTYKPQLLLKNVVEKAYVQRTGTPSGDTTSSDGGSQEQTGGGSSAPVLTIQKTGTGTMTVTDQTGHQIDSGAAVTAGQTLTISVTPAGSATPTATIGAQAVMLTEDEGQYVGTFQMPAASATLSVRTGGSGDNEE